MENNERHQVADNANRIETWEQLQARLFRLAEQGEELSAVASGPVTTWLYREIETEAARVAEVAGAYIDECERLNQTPRGGDRSAWRASLPRDEATELFGRRVDRHGGAGGGRP